MELSTIRDYLTPAINMITTLPKDIKEQVSIIHGDLEANAVTTAINIKKFITQIMDVGTLGLFITGGTFTISAVLSLKSYFSPFALLLTPVTIITTLASAALFSDSYQIYCTSKELYETAKKEYQSPDAQFKANTDTARKWSEFAENLKYKTWVAEPLARTFLDQITHYLQTKAAAEA